MADSDFNNEKCGSEIAADIERRNGAKDCITALLALEHSAENLPPSANDGAVYAAIQSGDAKQLIAQFGPLTPRQEGAFRALAEYIHTTLTTGQPSLDKWTPFVADTPEEIAAWATRVFNGEMEAA